MTPGITNENTVSLYLKYEKEFKDTAIEDTQNTKGSGEKPGRICMSIAKDDFVTPCQVIGRYIIEINEKYKSDSFKRCKYLNYKINSDDKYKNPDWIQKYKEISSKIGNICIDDIKTIPNESSEKLKKLYSHYDNFDKFNGKNRDSDGHICNSVRECYNIYNDNYKKCQINSNDPFCEELINFKKAYDNKMDKLSPCKDLPKTLPHIEQASTQILPPKKEDYVFVPILTTSIVLLMSFTIFFLYKFTPLKSWIYNRLRKKKIIELNKFREESRESLQNLHEEVNINYEGSSHNISYQPQGDT
ncbi:PIR protein [Plasmodium malariae]|uniref:PIR protein n=1 Tax=Plasmodium malariae TaxID=5858 RepID=A0A1D3JGQ4_PLAMA|nr:PIR protein [Plasmodium malariae]SBT85434.1 PIR protein [Plasmodium malariae]